MSEPSVAKDPRAEERSRIDAFVADWQRRCRGRLEPRTVRCLKDCARLLWRMQSASDPALRKYADWRWRLLGRNLTRCLRGAERRSYKDIAAGEAAIRRTFGSVTTQWGKTDMRPGPPGSEGSHGVQPACGEPTADEQQFEAQATLTPSLDFNMIIMRGAGGLDCDFVPFSGGALERMLADLAANKIRARRVADALAATALRNWDISIPMTRHLLLEVSQWLEATIVAMKVLGVPLQLLNVAEMYLYPKRLLDLAEREARMGGSLMRADGDPRRSLLTRLQPYLRSDASQLPARIILAEERFLSSLGGVGSQLVRVAKEGT